MSQPPARIIIAMGVSSSGKSTVGQSIARRLHVPFLDGDGYHPEANVEKMRAGTPLTDEDRWPWLERLALALHEAADRKDAAVGACSALKRSYRDFLTQKAGEPILFVYLDGSRDVIGERMARRSHEYMPTSLLDSQFATLEAPDPTTENVLIVPVTDSVEKITQAVTKFLTHLKSFKRWQ
ncbi:gluconokinase [Devosia neptuniae]|jgi:gluconokinase|uniref:gluconokinase n=1 Tax=Devosia TaxID=46913 RepID=UPI0022B048FC|nr:gluconokinase [Devosia neptuniae]MCZ4345968.1 gluconokinase [Devosia neptuniae]|tara:strand:- start:2729 stop:3271 length:543 start_codon:yes stop_codon:yes gene_type:complete